MAPAHSPFDLTAGEAALVAQAAVLARERVGPLAAQWERERRIGREVLAEAVALGLTRVQVPLAAGGLGLSFSCTLPEKVPPFKTT